MSPKAHGPLLFAADRWEQTGNAWLGFWKIDAPPCCLFLFSFFFLMFRKGKRERERERRAKRACGTRDDRRASERDLAQTDRWSVQSDNMGSTTACQEHGPLCQFSGRRASGADKPGPSALRRARVPRCILIRLAGSPLQLLAGRFSFLLALAQKRLAVRPTRRVGVGLAAERLTVESSHHPSIADVVVSLANAEVTTSQV